MVNCDIKWGITLGTNLKMPIFTLLLPHNLQSSSHNSLARLKGKSPNLQRSHPISYKAKFSQRDNIYLVDYKYNITYQNIGGKTKVRPIFIPWNP